MDNTEFSRRLDKVTGQVDTPNMQMDSNPPEIQHIVGVLTKESDTLLAISTELRDRVGPVLHEDDSKVPSPMEKGPEAFSPLGRSLAEIYSTLRNVERVLQDIEDRLEV